MVNGGKLIKMTWEKVCEDSTMSYPIAVFHVVQDPVSQEDIKEVHCKMVVNRIMPLKNYLFYTTLYMLLWQKKVLIWQFKIFNKLYVTVAGTNMSYTNAVVFKQVRTLSNDWTAYLYFSAWDQVITPSRTSIGLKSKLYLDTLFNLKIGKLLRLDLN